MRTSRVAAVLAVVVASALLAASCTAVDLEASATTDDVSAGEPVGEAADALTVINCKGLGLDLVECMIRCAQAGIPCSPRLTHPRKADAGDGDLFRCGEFGARKSCTYAFSNGDACVVISGLAWIPCVYAGG